MESRVPNLNQVGGVYSGCPIHSLLILRWKNCLSRISIATGEYNIKLWDFEVGVNERMIYGLIYFLTSKTSLYRRKSIVNNMKSFCMTPLLQQTKLVYSFKAAHTGKIKCLLQLKPEEDITVMISGSNDATIKFWNMETKENYKTFQTTGKVTAMIQVVNQNNLLTNIEGKGICRWDIDTGTIIETITTRNPYNRVNLIRYENTVLFCFSNEGILTVDTFWNPDTQSSKKSWIMINTINITCMEIFKQKSKSDQIIFGDYSGNIFAWEIKNSSLEVSWKAHKERISSIKQVTYNGNPFLLSSSLDGYIKHWDENFQLVHISQFLYEVYVMQILHYDRDDYVMTCGGQGIVRIWKNYYKNKAKQ